MKVQINDNGEMYWTDDSGNPISGYNDGVAPPTHAPRPQKATLQAPLGSPIRQRKTQTPPRAASPAPPKTASQKAYEAGKPQAFPSLAEAPSEIGRAIGSVPFNIVGVLAGAKEFIDDHLTQMMGGPRQPKNQSYNNFYKTGKLPYGLSEGRIDIRAAVATNPLLMFGDALSSAITGKPIIGDSIEIPLLSDVLRLANRASVAGGGIEPRTLAGGFTSELTAAVGGSFLTGGVSNLGKLGAIGKARKVTSAAGALKAGGLVPAATRASLLEAGVSLTAPSLKGAALIKGRNAYNAARLFPEISARGAVVAETSGKLGKVAAATKQTAAYLKDNWKSIIIDDIAYDTLQNISTLHRDPGTLTGSLIPWMKAEKTADGSYDLGIDARNFGRAFLEGILAGGVAESVLGFSRIALRARSINNLPEGQREAALTLMRQDPSILRALEPPQQILATPSVAPTAQRFGDLYKDQAPIPLGQAAPEIRKLEAFERIVSEPDTETLTIPSKTKTPGNFGDLLQRQSFGALLKQEQEARQWEALTAALNDPDPTVRIEAKAEEQQADVVQVKAAIVAQANTINSVNEAGFVPAEVNDLVGASIGEVAERGLIQTNLRRGRFDADAPTAATIAESDRAINEAEQAIEADRLENPEFRQTPAEAPGAEAPAVEQSPIALSAAPEATPEPLPGDGSLNPTTSQTAVANGSTPSGLEGGLPEEATGQPDLSLADEIPPAIDTQGQIAEALSQPSVNPLVVQNSAFEPAAAALDLSSQSEVPPMVVLPPVNRPAPTTAPIIPVKTPFPTVLGSATTVQVNDRPYPARWAIVDLSPISPKKGRKPAPVKSVGPEEIILDAQGNVIQGQKHLAAIHSAYVPKKGTESEARYASDYRQAITKFASLNLGILPKDFQAFSRPALVRVMEADLNAPASPSVPSSPVSALSDEAFASMVLSAANSTKEGRLGNYKVFISRVWETLQQQRPDPSLTLEKFKKRLVKANRLRQLDLSRADMAHALDQNDVAASEINDLNSSFHFIYLDPNAPELPPPPAEAPVPKEGHEQLIQQLKHLDALDNENEGIFNSLSTVDVDALANDSFGVVSWATEAVTFDDLADAFTFRADQQAKQIDLLSSLVVGKEELSTYREALRLYADRNVDRIIKLNSLIDEIYDARELGRVQADWDAENINRIKDGENPCG